MPINRQSSEQKKKNSDQSSKNNMFGQSAGDQSDTQTQKTAMFMNMRVSNSKCEPRKDDEKYEKNSQEVLQI